MIKLPYRHILLNGQKPMMQRKRFFWIGWWYNYEPHENHLIRLREKMNETAAKLQKQYNEYDEVQKEQRAIVNRVNNAKGEQDGEGHERYKKFPWFKIRHKPLPDAGKKWEDFVGALKHGNTEKQSPTDGVENVRIVGGDDDANTSIDGHTEETLNATSHEIKPHKNLSNKERKRQQQQQQQNNQQ